MRERAYNLMKEWCDTLLSYQVMTKTPYTDGALLCPACHVAHGRVADLCFPLTVIWSRTGEEKYLSAGKASFDFYYDTYLSRNAAAGGALDTYCIDKESAGPILRAALMLERLTDDASYLEKAENIAIGMPQKLKEKVSTQVENLLSDTTIAPERLEQEIVFLVMKADVKEEIDRLYAHIKTAFELLESNTPIGRRLDFLCQELNREANTLCSKSCDIEQTKYGMELKALIEQFREQTQNME